MLHDENEGENSEEMLSAGKKDQVTLLMKQTQKKNTRSNCSTRRYRSYLYGIINIFIITSHRRMYVNVCELELKLKMHRPTNHTNTTGWAHGTKVLTKLANHHPTNPSLFMQKILILILRWDHN